MKNIFFFVVLFYLTANLPVSYSFDAKRMQDDLDYIDKNFLESNEDETTHSSTLSSAAISKPLPNQEILDLENEYFDEVKTKKAALKKRSR